MEVEAGMEVQDTVVVELAERREEEELPALVTLWTRPAAASAVAWTRTTIPLTVPTAVNAEVAALQTALLAPAAAAAAATLTAVAAQEEEGEAREAVLDRRLPTHMTRLPRWPWTLFTLSWTRL
jgi:hypothetical protein